MKQKETIVELIARLASEDYTYENMTLGKAKEAHFLFTKKQESQLFVDERIIIVNIYAAGNVRNIIRQYFGN